MDEILQTMARSDDTTLLQSQISTWPQSRAPRITATYELLTTALKLGHHELALELLRKKCPVNPLPGSQINENTPLHYVAMTPSVELTDQLVGNRASVLSLNRNNETPIHIAAKRGYTWMVTKLFCENNFPPGADNQLPNCTDNHGISVLHLACISSKLSIRLFNRICKAFQATHKVGRAQQINNPTNNWSRKPINFDSPHWPGYTPLHMAIEFSNMKLLKALLKQKDSNCNAQDAKGRTPLHIAYYKRDKYFIQTIVEQAGMYDPEGPQPFRNLSDDVGLTTLHILAYFDVLTEQRVHPADLHTINKASIDRLPGYTAMHYVVERLKFERYGEDGKTSMQALLKIGANQFLKNQNGSTPLHMAFYALQYGLVDLLLSKYTPTSPNLSDALGLMHFHIASARNSIQVLEYFVAGRVNVNSQVSYSSELWPGYAALHFAVDYNSLEALKFLLQNRADLNLKNALGMTPIHMAYQTHREVFVDALLAAIDDFSVNPADPNKLTHFHIGCIRNDIRVVKEFMKRHISPNLKTSEFYDEFRPLHFAAKHHAVEVAKYLLERNADVGETAKSMSTAIHVACLQSSLDYFKVLEKVATNLPNRGINYQVTDSNIVNDGSQPPVVVNASEIESEIQSVFTKTPMYLNQIAIIDLLLEYACNVNALNVNDENALLTIVQSSFIDEIGTVHFDNFVAREFVKQQKRIFDYLIAMGIDVTVKNLSGETILHRICSWLIDLNEVAVEMAQTVIAKGCNPNAANNQGFTALHFATSTGNLDLVKYLIEEGADVNYEMHPFSESPLERAVKSGDDDIVQLFLENDVDVFRKDKEGRTILHTAVFSFPNIQKTHTKAIRIFQLLIEAGCPLDAKDHTGRTPVGYFSSIFGIMLLLNEGANINGFQTYPLDSEIQKLVVRMKLIGFYVNDVLVYYYITLNQFPYANLATECETEIARLKNTRIRGEHCSLYNVLKKRPENLVHLIENPEFQRIVRESEAFPIYGSLIKSQMTKARARKRLMDLAMSGLQIWMKERGSLPELVYRAVFDFLSNQDLYNLGRVRYSQQVKRSSEAPSGATENEQGPRKRQRVA